MAWNGIVGSAYLNCVVGTLTVLAAAPARAGDSMPAVAPQPLANALEGIARQASLQLIYSSSLSNGVNSPGSPAGLTWRESLHEVLKGTGLTYQLVNEHTVTILPEPKADADQSGSAFDQSPNAGAHSDRRRNRAGMPVFGEPPSDQMVVITGSHISGVEPSGGQVITIRRKEIERAGYSTVQDVIRALPQNFGGGASEDTRTSLEDTFNTSRGSGLNLRGLGAGATLVLINGRRIAASGSDGRFVDVSGIPLSAIDRVEILPDGASAIYGSDAVGGVVNFILRDDYDGVETQLKWGSVTSGSTKSTQVAQAFGNHWDSGNFLLSFDYHMRDNLPNAERWQSADSDLTARGGDNFDVTQGSPGTILQGPYMFAIPRGQDGTSLDPASLIPGTANTYNRNSGWDLLPEQKRWSMVGTVRENLSDRIRLFADTLFSERHSEFLNPAPRTSLSVPSSNGFFVNPLNTNDPVTVLYSFENDLGYERDDAEVQTAYAAAGGTMAFENGWDVTAYGSYSYARDFAKSDGVINQLALAMALADPNPETAFNPFGDGSHTNPETLASIRDFVIGRTVADVSSFNITAEGTLLHAADRDLRMAGGADFRSQGLETSFVQGATSLADSDRRRKVKGAYVEFLVPLIPEHQQYRGVHAAQLSLAARHESYSDFGSATTPKIGLSYSPLTNFTLRASWARSLKAPSLANLDTSRNSALVDLQRDPLVGDPNGTSYILIQTGGNDGLHEETANTWTHRRGTYRFRQATSASTSRTESIKSLIRLRSYRTPSTRTSSLAIQQPLKSPIFVTPPRIAT